MENRDLFKKINTLPQEVREIIEQFDDFSYKGCKKFVIKLNSVGYTCEYGLDAEPYNLQKLGYIN